MNNDINEQLCVADGDIILMIDSLLLIVH